MLKGKNFHYRAKHKIICGICGEIQFNHQPPSVSAVERMAQKLIARGPDAGGVFSQGNMAFGHRRLKIIDLSEHAQQPMHDPALGLTLAFNGCIYNYQELRTELQQLGYVFFPAAILRLSLRLTMRGGRSV